MLSKSNEISRSKQRSSTRLLRGVYGDEGDDLLSAYLLRYPSAVVTLETALSLYGITDEWLAPPFCFSFGLGYRPVDDPDITQIWDDNGVWVAGAYRLNLEGP